MRHNIVALPVNKPSAVPVVGVRREIVKKEGKHPAGYMIKDHTLYICPDGDIDDCAASKLKKRVDSLMAECDIKNIVFDFEKVDFMDSSGIGFIMGRYRKIAGKGGKMRAVGVKPVVMRILRYSGLYQIMDMEEKRPYGE